MGHFPEFIVEMCIGTVNLVNKKVQASPQTVHPEVVGNGARRLRRFNLSTPPRHRMSGRFSHPDAEAG